MVEGLKATLQKQGVRLTGVGCEECHCPHKLILYQDFICLSKLILQKIDAFYAQSVLLMMRRHCKGKTPRFLNGDVTVVAMRCPHKGSLPHKHYLRERLTRGF